MRHSYIPYIGSGQYCYTNCLAMLFGRGAPETSAIEVLTGSPFGFHLDGGLAWFDSLGWDPDLGIGAALDLLGWTCERTAGGSAADAVERLRDADGPVLVGPLEMGLLGHHPGSVAGIGADHFVVVTAADERLVHFHDPHGYPFATLPVDEFTAAWESMAFEYPADPFTMRTRLRRVRWVDVRDALHESLPAARRWLTPQRDGPAAASERFAGLVAAGLSPRQTEHLIHFAVKVGARVPRLTSGRRWSKLVNAARRAGSALAPPQRPRSAGLLAQR